MFDLFYYVRVIYIINGWMLLKLETIYGFVGLEHWIDFFLLASFSTGCRAWGPQQISICNVCPQSCRFLFARVFTAQWIRHSIICSCTHPYRSSSSSSSSSEVHRLFNKTKCARAVYKLYTKTGMMKEKGRVRKVTCKINYNAVYTLSFWWTLQLGPTSILLLGIFYILQFIVDRY